MKPKIPLLLLFIGLITFIFSCQQSQKVNTDVYTTALKLSDKIIDVYLTIDKINENTYYRQSLASILTDSGKTIAFKPILRNKNDIEIIMAYKDYLSDVYSKITNNENISDATVKADVKALLTLVDSLHPNVYSRKIEKISALISNPNIKFDILTYYVVDLLSDILYSDVKKWVSSVDSAYNVYAYKLDRIPISVFDMQKLQKYIYEPYKGNKKLVEIYKQNLKQEAMIYKNKFKDKATGAYIAMKDFKELLLELHNANPDMSFVYYKLAKIKAYTNKKVIRNDEK